MTRYPDTSQVDGEARGPTVGFGAGASADLNPLHDCLLLRPAVVQLPSVFHRVTTTAVAASSSSNNGNGNEIDTMPTSGSPSMSRKTRTIVSGGASAPSPTHSPYQSPKMKARNCHHHQQQQQQPNHSTKQTINGEVESPNPSPYHQQHYPHPNPRHQLSLMQQRVRTIVPKLTNDMQKGQCGRIGVFGGCIM